MNIPEAPELSFDWAEKSWQDPLTGTPVVRLSPDRKMHFRNNYFYNNLMTFDGKYAVFMGCEDLRDGIEYGTRSLWARDMISGEVRDLGPVPAVPESLVRYYQWVFRNSCGRTSHEDRRVEIEAAENAEPGVAAHGVPQQDAARSR